MKNKRAFIAFLALVAQAVVAADQPNVVIMLGDNVGCGDIGAYGAGEVRGMPTPRIDSIASRPDYYAQLAAARGVTNNPGGPDEPFDPAEPGVPKRVHRGGSFLCTDQYCSRYAVRTRGKGEISTGTNHLGFRCAQARTRT